MRVLVTGGTGFIGGFLVRRLLADGVETRALARPSSSANNLRSMGIEVIFGDLANPDAVGRAVHRVETVFHCGARVGSVGTRDEFFQSNVRGTELIVQESIRAGVKRVVYLSSLGVYGLPRDGFPITEDTEHDPNPEERGHYSHTKIIAERTAVQLAREHAFPLVVLRPGFVYGEKHKPPAGLLGFRRGKQAAVIGRKDCPFPLNYVDNLVDAMILAAQSERPAITQFNILDDDHLTQYQYSRMLQEIDGIETHFLPGWPFRLASPLIGMAGRVLPYERLKRFSRHQLDRMIQMVRYDTSRIRREFGWQPRVALGQGLQVTFRSQS